MSATKYAVFWSSMMPPELPLVLGPTRTQDRIAALRLLLGGTDDHEDVESSASGNAAAAVRERELEHLLTQAVSDPHFFDGLLTATRGQVVVGATWLRARPAGLAELWPPALALGEDAHTGTELLRAGLALADQSGAKLVQAVLLHAAGFAAERLTSAGFEQATDVLMVAADTRAAPSDESESALEFALYSDHDEARLVDVFRQTCQQSLDCPWLRDVMTVPEILGGYRADRSHAIGPWLFVHSQQRDIGLLLLSDQPGADQWELNYFGIIPSARGQALGAEILRHGIRLAARAGQAQLVSAVDAANLPAMSAYHAAGFMVCDRRMVFVRFRGAKL